MSSVWLCLYVSCYAIFLCFGSWAGCRSRSCALGLQQRVWILSFMHVYARLLLYFISMFVWLDLGFSIALFPSWVCAWSLGPPTCLVVTVPLMACLDVTICENTSSWCWFAWCMPFFHPGWWHACLACFVPSRLALLVSLHLCTFAYMFMLTPLCVACLCHPV